MPVEFLGIAGTNPASEVTPRTGGPLDLEYTTKLARAHEDNGWDRILFAYHSGSPDPAQVAAYVAGRTERINLVVAHRPNVAYPTLTALYSNQEYEDGLDDDLEFGLTRILDGIQVLIGA